MLQSPKFAPFLIIILSCSLFLSLWTLLSPPSRSIPLPLPRYLSSRLLNIPDFEYVINSNVCETQNVTLLVVVTSHPSHFSLRKSQRKDYGKDLWDLGVRRIFLLAHTSPRQSKSERIDYPPVSQELIEKESQQYRDIIQGNFEEAYRNLTYKHVMGLQWATRYCAETQFILKMDDDIVVDMYQLLIMLQTQYAKRQELLLGYIHKDLNPLRDQHSKWYVSRGEFGPDMYPKFLSGWAYVTTPRTASRLLRKTLAIPYFWIDDVYVTGLLRQAAGISLESWNFAFVSNPDYLKCCLRHSKYWCDYVVGPSGGDFDLVRKFLAHSRNCHQRGCKRRRNGTQPRICVNVNEPAKPSKEGKALVRPLNIK